MLHVPVGRSMPFIPAGDQLLPINPSLLPNAKLLLDASDTTTVFADTGMSTPLVATGSCRRWLSKAAGGRDPECVDTVTFTPPVWTTNLLNGKPGMVFDHNNNSCFFDAFANALPASGPWSFFFVMRIKFFSLLRTLIAGADFGDHLDIYLDATNKLGLNRQGVEVVYAGSTALTIDVPYIITGTWDVAAGTCSMWINGTLDTTTVGHTTSPAAPATRLGGDQAPAGWKAHLYEMGLYEAAISQSVWADLIRNYLNPKWAVF